MVTNFFVLQSGNHCHFWAVSGLVKKICQKSSSGPSGLFWPNYAPKLCKFISQDLHKGFFLKQQHDRAQQLEKNYLSKITQKNSFLGLMGNFSSIFAQHDASLYLKICFIEYFKLCMMIGLDKLAKSLKTSKKKYELKYVSKVNASIL